MPNPLLSTRGALAAEFDARQWAGSVLYTRDSGTFTVTAPAGWGVFGDVLDMLTGRGSRSSGTDAVNLASAASTATATPVVASITADDRIQLVFTGATSVVLSPSANNTQWGFDPAGQVSTAGSGSTQVLTAVSGWTRGNISVTRFNLIRGASNGLVPRVPGLRVHSILDTVRAWGSADADDLNPTDNLCRLDFDAPKYIRWGVTADGHVFCSRETLAVSDVTWVSTSFRDALGFTGLETPVVDGVVSTTTATYPCPGLLTPSRPFDTIDRGMQARFGASLASNGGAYVTSWLDRVTYGVALLLDGPADRIDRQDHMLRAVLPAMPPGARVTVYQDWGDYRRAARTADTSNPAVAPRVAPYSLLYTSQRDGEYGRLLCRRDPGESGALVAAWPDRIKRRMPVVMQVAEWEGGQ